MSDKFMYQNARVKSMEASLFTVQSVARLLDCTTVQSAFRALLDMGFGAGVTMSDCDFDTLFLSEEEKAAAFLREFNVDGALDAFLVQYDFLNLKALFKSKITGKKAVTAPNGLYEVEQIKAWLDVEGQPEAPVQFVKAISELKKLENVSPHAVDCIVDKCTYAYVFSTKKKMGKAAYEYFVRKVDGLNVGAFMRCKRLGLSKSYFEEGFIEGGELDFLPAIYELGTETLKEKCKRTPYEETVAKVVDDGNLVAFEVEQDNALLKVWKDKKDDMFSVAPIVAFYLTKITQIRVAKLAVAGIKNGVEQSQIRERMREIYA
ncbi:MAG: V-type ATPase subunit [Clostridiales bacterium]|nr:V-type ATPase subunit [Clostridiales bacterium]